MVIMMKIARTVFRSGERYSLLLDEGTPVWYPTLFATSQLRNSAKAPNTIEAYLNAIRHLLEWAQSQNIVLEDLFSTNQFLTVEQVENLCDYLKKKKRKENYVDLKKPSILRKELHRAKYFKQESVSNETLYIRISYVSDYIEWLAKYVLSERRRTIDSNISQKISRMLTSLNARRPKRTTSSRHHKMGLAYNQRAVLLNIVDPQHPGSPFSDNTKGRDSLIIEILYKTGIRLGELLSIRISDFNFQNNTLLIPRRHDDPSDPRTKQPVVKTLDRLLPLSRQLSETVHNYILKERARIDNAKKNDFLFVTYKIGPYCGEPLSASSVYCIFRRINQHVKELSDLTPHILRHTWNDMFSEKVDEQGIGAAEEEKIRSFLMGWKEGSGTSAIYTRRHIEKKAHEVSLLLQGGRD